MVDTASGGTFVDMYVDELIQFMERCLSEKVFQQ